MDGDIVSTLEDNYMVFGISENWVTRDEGGLTILYHEMTFQRIFIKYFKATNFSWTSTPLLASEGRSSLVPSILFAKLREKLPDTVLVAPEQPVTF